MNEQDEQPTVSNPLEHVVMWINPDDELPPLGELVLVRTTPGNIVSFDNICDTGGWLKNSYVNNPKKHDVMWWMKIPEKPQST